MKKILLSSLLALAVQPMVFANEPTKAPELPAAVVIDADMDMEKTMKFMKKSFKKLGKADDIQAMIEPAKTLADYTSQSVVLAEQSKGDKREDLINGLNKLRMNIAELQGFIDKGDFAAAKKKVKAINEQRKKAHEYFDVD